MQLALQCDLDAPWVQQYCQDLRAKSFALCLRCLVFGLTFSLFFKAFTLSFSSFMMESKSVCLVVAYAWCSCSMTDSSGGDCADLNSLIKLSVRDRKSAWAWRST